MPSITGVRTRGVILDGLTALPAATSVLTVSSAGVMEAATDVNLGENTLTCGQVNLYDAGLDSYTDLSAVDGDLLFDNEIILSAVNFASYAVPFTGATIDVNLNGHSLTTRKVIAQATAAADIVGLFKGTTSQTGDLIECQDVTAAVVAKTTADGSQHARQFIPGGGSSSNPLIFAFASAAYSSQTTTGTGVSLFPTAIPVNGIGIALAGNALAGTSGNYFHVNEAITFAPTSGTATFSGIRLVPTISQTGGASGITRGIIVSPSITAAADWRSIETSNNSGYAFYGAGTAPSQFGGNVVSSALMCAGAYTVGTLPSASANAGKFAQVTDSSVTTFGSTVAGGGSNRRQVFSDGTNWIID